jgi:hypothetical protein
VTGSARFTASRFGLSVNHTIGCRSRSTSYGSFIRMRLVLRLVKLPCPNV